MNTVIRLCTCGKELTKDDITFVGCQAFKSKVLHLYNCNYCHSTIAIDLEKLRNERTDNAEANIQLPIRSTSSK
jgi:hypothetical protein